MTSLLASRLPASCVSPWWAKPAVTGGHARITYFGRDVSLSKSTISESIFCHDTAFYLDYEKDVLDPEISVGHFFRRDVEKHPNGFVPKLNIDISAAGNQFTETNDYFRILSKYETILADRLHVGIAGAMMGRQVRLFPGSYEKNAGSV